MKKITSMFLAMVMALALTVPAFASSGTVKVDSTIQLPTINVVLPTTASMVMNPYKMSVKLNSTTTASDQIVSSTMEVKNLSNIDIQVGIKVTGTIKNTTDTAPTFATSSAANDTTNKTAYIYVAFEVGDTGLDVADTNGSGGSTVVLTTGEQEVTDFASTASAGNANTLKASADLKAPSTNGVLGFKFFGDTSAVTTWADKDVMSATIAFTFTPLANAAATPSAGDASVTVAISGTTANATFNAGTSGLTAASYSWSSSDTSVATVAGTTASGTITQDGSATTGQTSTITVTVTLSNGATITGTDTFTAS